MLIRGLLKLGQPLNKKNSMTKRKTAESACICDKIDFAR
jgi:hypothetical protein